jgi:DNA invertase Pin-like site-specific DNA recombinase
MNKITPEHLAREAYIYVRQSTPDQLLNNPESRRRQYALVERARALGWEHVIVVDEDLGRSGGGQLRPGFERLLAAICAGTAGAVLAIEVSRLARNGRDWHTLLEFCAFANSLIIDEDGIYDPRLINDRLLLGLKGTFSELELSMFRQRSREALRLKAARGDLHLTVAIGVVLMIAWSRTPTGGSVRCCLWCSASSARSAACASSPCGCGRRRLTCRLSSMVPRAGSCSGARRATTRFIGC